MNRNWSIEQNDFENEKISRHMESLFTLGNGFIGIRGDFPLSEHVYQKGTYINGFYESGPITYGEKAYGYAEKWQTIVPLPEGKDLNIFINGKELFCGKGFFRKRKRFLDMKESHCLWEFIWCDENGLEYHCSVKILVPFKLSGSVLFIWDITMPEEKSEIIVKSPLNLSAGEKNLSDDPRLPGHFDGSTLKSSISNHRNRNILSVETSGSALLLECVMSNICSGISDVKREVIKDKQGITERIEGRSGRKVSIVKALVYSYGSVSEHKKIEENLLGEIELIENSDIKKIEKEQKTSALRFWENSDVEITGDDEVQLSMRYNLFQLLQSTGRDGKRSIAAKGLSGTGYEGHYFWDAETYVLPFFIYSNSEIARSLLKYRISIIKDAEKRAQLLGHKGILFPWRTINGEESSAYFPAGTAQYHINSDISLGLIRYLEITGDVSILKEGGSELLAGTARFWSDFGIMIEGKGFCFNTVTGPDEYTAIVDNNFYTNLSAKENLKGAVRWLEGFVSRDELNLWKSLSEQIYLPPTDSVTPQDDTFLSKEPWDFHSTGDENYPLLLHYHPLNIYRKQVLKQADVILAQVLFPSELPQEQKKRNFDYYEQLTTRDSSLSACAQGISAFQLGYEDLAWEYFNETLHTDRKDLHSNVFHGLHTASMGGSYLLVLYGFLGLESLGSIVRFCPRIPTQIKKMSLNIRIQKKRLYIEIDHENIRYRVTNGDIVFIHDRRRIELKNNEEVHLPVISRQKVEYQLFRPRINS